MGGEGGPGTNPHWVLKDDCVISHFLLENYLRLLIPSRRVPR